MAALKRFGPLLALLLLTVWAYRGVQTAQYVYEDHNVGAEKDRMLLGNTPRAPWRGWVDEWHAISLAPRTAAAITSRLQVWADASARGFHLGNLGVHLLNGALCWAVLLPYGAVAAGAGAALWLLHPMQVESVAYVAARTDLLMATAIWLLLLAARVPGWRGAMGMTLAGLFAIAAKETGVVVIVLLPLWLVYERRAMARAVVPLLAWISLAIPVAVRLLRVSGPGPDRWHALAQYVPAAPHGPFWYAAVQCAALWRYAGLLVWPVGFTVDHDFDAVPRVLAFGAMVATIGALTWAWRARRAHPNVACALAWVPGALAPRFVIALPDYINEHQIVIALIGPCLMAAIGLSRLWDVTRTLSDAIEAVSISRFEGLHG